MWRGHYTQWIHLLVGLENKQLKCQFWKMPSHSKLSHGVKKVGAAGPEGGGWFKVKAADSLWTNRDGAKKHLAMTQSCSSPSSTRGERPSINQLLLINKWKVPSKGSLEALWRGDIDDHHRHHVDHHAHHSSSFISTSVECSWFLPTYNLRNHVCVSTLERLVTTASDSSHLPQEGSDGSHSITVTVQSKLDCHVMGSSLRGHVTLTANELSHGKERLTGVLRGIYGKACDFPKAHISHTCRVIDRISGQSVSREVTGRRYTADPVSGCHTHLTPWSDTREDDETAAHQKRLKIKNN